MRSGHWGHLQVGLLLDPQELKHRSFGGVVVSRNLVILVNILSPAIHSHSNVRNLLPHLSINFTAVSSHNFFKHTPFVFCCLAHHRSADEETRRVHNEQAKGWRYFNWMFSLFSSLLPAPFFKLHGDGCVCICVLIISGSSLTPSKLRRFSAHFLKSALQAKIHTLVT